MLPQPYKETSSSMGVACLKFSMPSASQYILAICLALTWIMEEVDKELVELTFELCRKNWLCSQSHVDTGCEAVSKTQIPLFIANFIVTFLDGLLFVYQLYNYVCATKMTNT